MSFTSAYSIVLPLPPTEAYEQLSGTENFITLLKLSPTCHLVEIQATDEVLVQWSTDPKDSASQTLAEISQQRPSVVPGSSEGTGTDPSSSSSSSSSAYEPLPASRIHFRLIERTPVLIGGLTKDVEVIGTQLFVPSLRLQLYEAIVGGGTVKIYKLRRFVEEESDGQVKTRVEELISGETSWMLRRYTEGACREAHAKHMDVYEKMIKT